MGGVIVAGLSLDWLADYIARKGAPEGAALAITDRNGIYLARYPHNDRFVGTKMPGDKYLKMDERGAADTLNVDGVERIEGYSALGADSGGLVVSFGLSKAPPLTEIQNRRGRRRVQLHGRCAGAPRARIVRGEGKSRGSRSSDHDDL